METECREMLESALTQFWQQIQDDNTKRNELDTSMLSSQAEIKAMIKEFKELYIMRHNDLSDRVSKTEEQIREIRECKVDKDTLDLLVDNMKEISEKLDSKLSAEDFKAFIDSDFRPIQEKKHEINGAWWSANFIWKAGAAIGGIILAAIGIIKSLGFEPK